MRWMVPVFILAVIGIVLGGAATLAYVVTMEHAAHVGRP